MSETVSETAAEALRWFETAKRPDGERFTRTMSDAPEWVGELVREAHGDMLPDDWRYECIRAALETIEEVGEDEDGLHEFADSYVDVYNSDRVAWLGSHGRRPGYCDDAAREFGGGEDIIDRIGLGQYAEASEVYGLVLQGLGERTAVAS